MNSFELKDIVKHFVGQANIASVPMIFKKWLGSYNAAVLLGQIIYWTERTDDPEGWFFKSCKDWESEIYLTEKESRNAIELLESLGIIETKKAKINGAPTKHFRLKADDFHRLFVEFLKKEQPAQVIENKGANPFAPEGESICPRGQNLSSQKLLTKRENTCAGVEYTKNGTRGIPLNQSINQNIELYMEPIRDFYGGVLADEFRWGSACVKAIEANIEPEKLISALSSLMTQNRNFPITPENVVQMAIEQKVKSRIVKTVSSGLSAEEQMMRSKLQEIQDNYYARR